MARVRARRVCAGVVIALLALPAAHAQSPDASDWGYYGGDSFGQRFSSLDQINRENVAQLTSPGPIAPGSSARVSRAPAN